MLIKALRTHTDAYEIDEEKKFSQKCWNHKKYSSKNETSKRTQAVKEIKPNNFIPLRSRLVKRECAIESVGERGERQSHIAYSVPFSFCSHADYLFIYLFFNLFQCDNFHKNSFYR